MTSDVHIVVDGEELRDWTSYQIESDILQPADAFSFTVANTAGKHSGKFQLFDPVQVIIDGVPQLSGYVDEITRGVSSDAGPTLSIVGRDTFGQLVDCCAEPKQYRHVSLLALAEAIASSWIASWSVENERNRIELLRLKREVAFLKSYRTTIEAAPIDFERVFVEPMLILQEGIRSARIAELERGLFQNVKVEPGERVFEILDRASRKLGFLLWCAADGTGIIARPNFTQSPIYELHHHAMDHPQARQNNIIESEVTERGAERYAAYRFLGTAGNSKKDYGTAARFRSDLEDDEMPVVMPYRRLLIESVEGKTRKEIDTQAKRDLQQRRFDGLELNYTVRGHRNRGLLWQADTMAIVEDSLNAVTGSYYVSGRRFVGDVNGGQRTELRLHRPGTLLP